MAPLNLEKNEDDNVERIEEEKTVCDKTTRDINLYKLDFGKNSLHQRHTKKEKTENILNKLKEDYHNGNVVEKIDNAENCVKLEGATNSRDSVTERINSKDNCESCMKENAKKMHIYHRRQSDAIVKNSSLRTAIIEISPQWFRSLLQDPEYIMTEAKSKDSEKIHRQADSLFSTSSGFTNYRGLLNLCLILLVLSNARLFLENIIKYGILIDPIQWITLFLNQPYSATNMGLIAAVNVFILVMYWTELAMAKSWFSENTAVFIQTVTLVLLLTIPAGVTLYLHPNPLISTMILGMYTVAFLKLVSYSAVNKWCRQSQSPKRTKMKRSKSVSVSEGVMANDKDDTCLVTYPDNLNYADLYYFMVAPTLCYELNFPRSLRIRKRFLLKRLIEMVVLIQLILACIQQWILPLVHNSLKPLAEMDAARCTERLLKLAVPNHFIWLMFFYWFFHSSLNVLAELLKFGDREFYRDWWNSDTVNEFWKNWNIPVHRWATRHLYKPLVKRGCSRLNASVAVFFLSAFFHEYLLSVPLQMFRLWAFMGMLGQVPLAMVQVKYINGKYGNIVVWLSLIMGQPVAILAYFHDYYVMQIADVIPANQTASL